MSSETLSLLMIKAKAATAASMSESGYLAMSERAKQAIFAKIDDGHKLKNIEHGMMFYTPNKFYLSQLSWN